MNSPDPASLQNLNDIVLPGPVGWWPLASGWYYLLGFLLLGLAWFIYKAVKDWNRNRYRRAALNELKLLATITQDTDKRDASLRQLPVLLKRTALSVYPRSQLASLTGKNWHDFLNSKVSTPSFTESQLDLMDRISYSVGDLKLVDPKAADELFGACRHWLKHHQPAEKQKPLEETGPC
jgi:hypothetical protein